MLEFGARLSLKDNMYATLHKNLNLQRNFSEQVKKTRDSIKSLGSQKANPVITAKDNASKKVDAILEKMREAKRTAVAPVIRIKDKVTGSVNNVKKKLKNIATTFTPIVKLRDMATKGISKIKNTLGGIGKHIAKPLVALKDGATAGLSKIGDMLKSLAKGITIGIGLAGAGATMLLKGSLGEGASLEQSIGGVETLFKGDAGAVIENANKAYKTAGLSANEYMETVTSFSASLLQSLGGDTKKASDVADMALIDMADNANKFGTDMGSIQNAYQGFAKQNYTMLDNLKLGYGGTKEEMQRLLSDAQKLTGQKYDISNLSDVYNAIHAVQNELGVTGTTAKEGSTTFAGSMASMKASAKNFMGALALGGDMTAPMEEMIDSASTFLFDNALPMIGRIFEGLPQVIEVAVKKGAPKLKELGGTIVNTLKNTIKSLLPSGLGDMVDPLFSGLGGAIKGSVGALQGIFSEVAPIITDSLSGMFDGGGFLETLTSLFSGAVPIVSSIATGLATAFSYVMPVVQSLGNMFVDIMPTILQVVDSVISAVNPIIQSLGGVIERLIPPATSIIQRLGRIFEKIFPIISTIVTEAIEIISPILETVMDVFDTLLGVVEDVFPTIQGIIEKVWGVLKPIIGAIADGIGVVGDAIGGIAKFVGKGISSVGSWLGFAYGKDRVPYNNYPAVLHEGEKVLTRTQADQYERAMSTRGIQLNSKIQPVESLTSTTIGTNTGSQDKEEVKEQVTKGGSTFNIEKLADTVVIEKEADVDRVVEDMVAKFKKLIPNMA